MNCPKCNAPIEEGVQFCPNCGNNLNDTQVEVSQPEVVNNVVEPVIPVDNNVSAAIEQPQDKVNVLLVILSWFIPLAGLIIFFVKKNTSPKTAKASGICALISALLSVIMLIASFALIWGSFNNLVDNTFDQANEIIDQTQDEIENEFNDNVSNNGNTSTDVTTPSTDVSVPSTSLEVSKDWKQYQIGINNKVYSLPMSYSEIQTASGFSLKSDYVNLVLPDKHYALVNLFKNDKLALYIELFNNTGAEIKYVDGKVTRVSQTKYQVSQGADAIIFPGGLKAGDSITDAQIIALFGQPNDLKDYTTSKQYTYLSDTTWTTTNNYKIKIVDGIIDEIQLDNRK